MSVAAGAGRAALCVGAERMTHAGTDAVTSGLAEAGETITDGAVGLTFPGFFGLVARAHGAAYGTRREHLSAVTVKNRRNASNNKLAMFTTPVSADQVAASRPIADPLTLLDCSPISDGAAAAVVVGPDLVPASMGGAVRIRSTTQTSGPVAVHHMNALTTFPATVAAAEIAYREAGISAADIDVVELHDCFSITEIVNTGDLGFFDRGDVADAILEQLTAVETPGLVVNPGGGLLGRGHPVGATGLAQVAEIVSQLRGTAANQVRDAGLGMAHNLGGAGATCTITILEGL
jgi:acetyl-CoA C-acetyltransferase